MVSELIGKAMWACGRAADMATFQFGGPRPVVDFYGRPREVGEYALHVQCPWRIVRDGLAADGERAGIGRQRTAHDFDQCGLARAVLTGKRMHLARTKLERHVR